MPDPRAISFAPTTPDDLAAFSSLRKAVMREHVERQGLPWDEWEEDLYQARVFGIEGLRSIYLGDERIGFVGVHEKENAIEIDRFCLKKEVQNKGIGSRILKQILDEPPCRALGVTLNVLKVNPAVRLYKRFGFVFVREDDKLAYFALPAQKKEFKIIPPAFNA